MALYRSTRGHAEAMQLLPENWNDLCAFAGVGELSEGKPSGCYIDANGQPILDSSTSGEIGLLIPTGEGLIVARQYDYIVKAAGDLIRLTPAEFMQQPFAPA